MVSMLTWMGPLCQARLRDLSQEQLDYPVAQECNTIGARRCSTSPQLKLPVSADDVRERELRSFQPDYEAKWGLR